MSLMEPHHINACSEDLMGNNGIGRYIFLTGSDERARELSTHFEQVTVRHHPRQHNLYLGTLTEAHYSIDVAAIATGMGGPSADIILNELILLGARRLLRIGTAGSLQPERIHVGDVVVATAAVRDDKASWDYIYKEYPAIASWECLSALHRAALTLPAKQPIHYGIVHSKSSLFARECHLSLLAENDQYMASLGLAGVLATEMECAQLFILSQLMSARLLRSSAQERAIHSGCILAIIGDNTAFSPNKKKINQAIKAALTLGIATVKELYKIDTRS